jgi:4-diphosphocytidyl-2-C-methyl-D-erythritol kinase
MSAPFTLLAPAKVNLSLEVRRRRADGYHELRSLMVKVGLYDRLRFAPAPDGVLSLSCDVPGLSCGEDNLIVKAARLLQARAGRARGARIRLSKRIPMAAGLAGGSADAAAALLGLKRLWRLRLDARTLASLALQLGSDVPFCLDARTAALARGRGEELSPVPRLPRLWLVLAKPPVAVPTSGVYQALGMGPKAKPGPDHSTALVKALCARDWDALQVHCVNDLEQVTQPKHPVIRDLKACLTAQGALVSRMSGSGPTVWALFHNRTQAVKAMKTLKDKGLFKAALPLL